MEAVYIICSNKIALITKILFIILLGKSSLLSVLGNREVPIPEHIDIFHLTREMPASDKSALQCVMEVDEERVKLEKLAEELAQCDDEGSYYIYLKIICL